MSAIVSTTESVEKQRLWLVDTYASSSLLKYLTIIFMISTIYYFADNIKNIMIYYVIYWL
jgi:hypothetical protein